MRINHNITALNTYRQLSTNTDNQSKSIEKLSSGLRINRAGDDAAGLAISEKMRGQIRGLDQASRNAQDGISLIQSSEGALNETHDILQRMRELAVQSSNGTNTDTDRNAIQSEMNQLTSEVNRIGNTTEFNTQKLLKGSNAKAVTTAAGSTTVAAGLTGVAAGALSALTTVASSVVGIASNTTVQGQTSKATGAVGTFLVTQNSILGTKAAISNLDGLSFSANSKGTSLNATNITMAQASGISTGSVMTFNAGTSTYTMTVGTDSNGASLALNKGTLYVQVDSAIKAYNALPANAANPTNFTVNPSNDTAGTLPASIAATSSFTGGIAEQVGTSQFTVNTAFKEAGDTVTVGGQTFTAAASGAIAANGQFNINAINSYVDGGANAAATTDVSGVTGTDNITVGVGATNFAVNTATLVSYGGAGKTNTDLVNLVNNAVDGSGNKLSSVADVSITNGKLEIIAKTGAAGTNVTANITGAAVATLTGFAVGATGTTQAGAATGAVAVDQARSLRVAIDSKLGTQYSASGSAAAGQIILTENSNQATGVNLTAPTVAGSGTDNKLTVSNGNGVNLNTVTIKSSAATAGVQALTTLTDGSFKLTATNKGTELNGVSVKFSGLTNTAGSTANTLNTAWDAATRTLTVSGNIAILGANSAASVIATDMATAVSTGITNAGYSQPGALTGTAGGSAGIAGAATAAFNGTTITFGSGATTIVADTLAVDENNGNLTIHLANASSGKNSAANIQTAIRSLSNVNGNDYSKFTTTVSGNWDTTETGSDIIQATGTLVGGTKEVNGSYSTTLSTPFATGDKVNIKGQIFTAVASGADSTKGQFNVNAGNTSAQASSLSDALNLNTVLKNTYTAFTTGSTLSLTENKATGTDLKTSDLKVSATGVNGQYTVDTSQLLTNGASIAVDGQQISVSNKDNNVGYANGIAIKESTSSAQQTQALSDAINKNASLNQLYTASVSADGKLQLDQKVGNTTAPSVQLTTSTKGDFGTSFQVGANSGQSMSIGIKDMRSEALGISGDGSNSTVAAKDGSVASYVSVANITDGTSTKNTEFSLDVSSADKATAAVSVISDAIEAVSAQRSQLGAYQNRLEHTINNLNTSSENLTSAESRIRDVDMAKEMMNQSKNSILAQAAQAMLAQANQQPQGTLQLLR